MIEIRANYVGGMFDITKPVRIFAMWYDTDGSGWFSYQVVGEDGACGKMLVEEITEFEGLHRFFPGSKQIIERPETVLP